MTVKNKILTYYMEPGSVVFHEMLKNKGFIRTYGLSLRPDIIIIGPDPTIPVSPLLYNGDLDKHKTILPSVKKERDYKDLATINAAKLEGIPIIGIGRGANILHVSNGGELLPNTPSSVNQQHCLFDPEGDLIENSLVAPSYDNQYIDLSNINFLDLYTEVLIGPEDVVSMFYCKERKQLGVRFPIINGNSNSIFFDDFLEKFKEEVM